MRLQVLQIPEVGPGSRLALCVLLGYAAFLPLRPDGMHYWPVVVVDDHQIPMVDLIRSDRAQIYNALIMRASDTNDRLPAYDSAHSPAWAEPYTKGWRPKSGYRFIVDEKIVNQPIDKVENLAPEGLIRVLPPSH